MSVKNTIFHLLLACYKHTNGLVYEFDSSGTSFSLPMKQSWLPFALAPFPLIVRNYFCLMIVCVCV